MSNKTKLCILFTALTAVVALQAGVETWKVSLLILAVTCWIYHSYRVSLAQLGNERKHVEEMTVLQHRTIEALALAIEAKDGGAAGRVRRVELYAIEIGKELGLSDLELKALRAAALLRDIGKLGVPEHIISKPGILTPVEFEKMKTHSAVGAGILERVGFPYPVTPIVRSHHERWDGSGYPDGLRGEQIPVGARILAAVDCLDALASERRHRRALPFQEAVAKVAAEAGRAFDPRVVEALARRHSDLERILLSERERNPCEPAGADFALHGAGEVAIDFRSAIAGAREEGQTLLELTHELGSSLSLYETMSVLETGLQPLCPHDSIAIYIRRDNKLVSEYSSGKNFQRFSGLEIPLGEGLVGWAAANRSPIVNGDPSVEPGYCDDAGNSRTLQSALVAPLEGPGGVVGVLALYRSEKDAFTQDHLRILLAVAPKVGLSIENALKYTLAEACATTDALTGLPNARSLFLHLDREIARCKRQHGALTVLVCDLNGFKQVNDRFGHLEGNKLLRTIAQGLQENCREYDYVARMGGDEFVVVLSGQPPESVATKVGLLSKVVSRAGRLHCGEDVLSMSVGEAAFLKDGSDAEQLLAKADQRMYQVKQSQKLFGAEKPQGWNADTMFVN